MGICVESTKGSKGDVGPKGDSCGNLGEQIQRNETYIGPKGEKGMIGMKVNPKLLFKLLANRFQTEILLGRQR